MGFKMSATAEICSVSGILKVCEILFGFITVIIHRYGDYGKMLFFGTAAVQLSPNDPGTDAENLGNGLLVSYVIDGRYAIQGFFLEWLWNFVGFVLYTGTGVISAITWTNAKNMDDDLGDKARNYDAALTMSAFCILQGLIYFVDFIFAKRARNRILEDGY